jgi:type II secretion system protein N
MSVTNKKVKISEKTLVDEIYSPSKGRFLKLLLLGLSVFVITFFLSFPIRKNIESLIVNALASNKACPLSYNNLRVEFLWLPKIVLNGLSVPAKCFGKSGEGLAFDQAIARFSMLVPYPPAIKLKISLNKKKDKINIFPKIGFGKQEARIDDTNISIKNVMALTPYPNLLKGNVELDFYGWTKSKKLEKATLEAKSQNLLVNSQLIKGFQIPTLELGQFQLVSVYEKNNLLINKLILGSEGTPLQVEFTGNIKINPSNVNSSKLDLKGRIKFGEAFLRDFGILNLLLSGKKKTKEGFYTLELKGPLSFPKHNFL